ncbi:MAG: hypothetical protein RL077_43 [Verrucomicrobiota bacterium]
MGAGAVGAGAVGAGEVGAGEVGAGARREARRARQRLVARARAREPVGASIPPWERHPIVGTDNQWARAQWARRRLLFIGGAAWATGSRRPEEFLPPGIGRAR